MTFSRITCHVCHQSFGQEARFLDHLTDIHGITDHLQEYLNVFNKGIHPTCECSQECESRLKWAGWKKGFTSKYVRGHNARVNNAFKDLDIQEKILKKRLQGYKEGRIVSWNKGLTKENDKRLMKQSKTVSKTLNKMHKSGDIVPWQITNPEKLKLANKKSSKTKKKKFDNGEITPWNKGLTKITDERILKISKKIRQSYKKPEMGNRIKLKQLQSRIDAHSNKFTLMSDLSSYKTRRVDRLKFKCVNCNLIQEKSLAMLEECPRCFNCYPKESNSQLEIFDFVKSIAPDAILSDRNIINPKELDIYVPSKRFAIEFNGLYWHSEKFLSTNYHQEKHDTCQEKNITLLSVFEDEWHNKQDIIKGMIKHRLRADSVILNARDTIPEIIKTVEARSFFDSSHIEGYTRSKITFVLKDKFGQVVAGLSLREPFHKLHASNIEVARCAVKSDHNVRGWLGKLTKAASSWAKDNGYKSMMTYVDSRIGVGDAYIAAGWKVDRKTKSPRFWWTNYENRFNRFKYKANKLRNMTQQQIAEEAGVVKIFGCNNFVLKYNIFE